MSPRTVSVDEKHLNHQTQSGDTFLLLRYSTAHTPICFFQECPKHIRVQEFCEPCSAKSWARWRLKYGFFDDVWHFTDTSVKDTSLGIGVYNKTGSLLSTRLSCDLLTAAQPCRADAATLFHSWSPVPINGWSSVCTYSQKELYITGIETINHGLNKLLKPLIFSKFCGVQVRSFGRLHTTRSFSLFFAAGSSRAHSLCTVPEPWIEQAVQSFRT